MRTGADTSNYTGAPSAEWDGLAGAINLLAPQAIHPPAGYPPDVTAPQVQWSLDHGLLTAPYIWKWFGTGISDIQRRLDLLSQFTGQVDHLWLDVEDTYVGVLPAGANMLLQPHPQQRLRMLRQPPPPIESRSMTAVSGSLQARIDEVGQALELMDQFPTKSGLKTGIYTGGWYWGPYMGNSAAFADRPLWSSLYDNHPDYRVWTPYGGWTALAIKQWMGTSTLAGIGQIDQNVLADDYLLPLLLAGPGLNVGSYPGGVSQPDPARLLALGFKWIRLVSAQRNADYINQCVNAGLDVVPIVTGESQGWVPGNVKTVQFGNEPDNNGPASWPTTEDDYVSQFAMYQGTYPQFTWIGAGMASGDPNWWARVAPRLTGCAAVAVHPYGKTANLPEGGTRVRRSVNPDSARALLSQYRAISPRLVVSEWNRPVDQIAEYIGMLKDVADAHAWAMWSDEQTLRTENIRMGLVDEFGADKPEMAAMEAALGTTPAPPPPPDTTWHDMVVATAGELGTVADQIDAAGDQIKQLAQGVRDRANKILG